MFVEKHKPIVVTIQSAREFLHDVLSHKTSSCSVLTPENLGGTQKGKSGTADVGTKKGEGVLAL